MGCRNGGVDTGMCFFTCGGHLHLSGSQVFTTSSIAINAERAEYCATGGTLLLRKPTPTFSGFYSIILTKLW
jgi:hypothetical protein